MLILIEEKWVALDWPAVLTSVFSNLTASFLPVHKLMYDNCG